MAFGAKRLNVTVPSLLTTGDITLALLKSFSCAEVLRQHATANAHVMNVFFISYYLFSKLSFTLGFMTLLTFLVHVFTLTVASASTELAEEQIRKE